MKILIPIYTGLGNAILIIPVIRTIKKVYPDAIIDLIGDNKYSANEIFQNDLDINNIFIDFPEEKYNILIFLKFGGSLKVIFKNIFKLKNTKIILQKNINKYCSKKELFIYFIFNFILKIKFINIQNRHESYNNLLTLKYLGVNEKDFVLNPLLSEQVIQKGILSSQRFNLSDNYIVLCPEVADGNKTPKVWEETYWIALINLLKKYQIVILGKQDNRLLSELNNINIVNLISKTKIIDLIGILNKSKLVVGLDSGITHLSSAMNLATLVLFWGTSFDKTRQIGTYTKFLLPNISCSPCSSPYGLKSEREAYDTCSYRLKCTKILGPQRVFKEIKNILEG
ncbi:MAG: glycosyltransferase family 9 protein [bacterium]|nr:glycosyltransferase family 9 protein [bacterium]